MLPDKLRCRDATRLLLEAEERELSAAEQLALKLHLKDLRRLRPLRVAGGLHAPRDARVAQAPRVG